MQQLKEYCKNTSVPIGENTDAAFVGDFVDIVVANQLDKVKQFNDTEEQLP